MLNGCSYANNNIQIITMAQLKLHVVNDTIMYNLNQWCSYKNYNIVIVDHNKSNNSSI